MESGSLRYLCYSFLIYAGLACLFLNYKVIFFGKLFLKVKNYNIVLLSKK